MAVNVHLHVCRSVFELKNPSANGKKVDLRMFFFAEKFIRKQQVLPFADEFA
jgi:hypothetical protein